MVERIRGIAGFGWPGVQPWSRNIRAAALDLTDKSELSRVKHCASRE
jgi:hypothetical protein